MFCLVVFSSKRQNISKCKQATLYLQQLKILHYKENDLLNLSLERYLFLIFFLMLLEQVAEQHILISSIQDTSLKREMSFQSVSTAISFADDVHIFDV